MTFKPLLASPAELDTLRYSVLGSPKLDGIRGMVIDARVVSRKLIEIPNENIQKMFGHKKYEGFDGEFILGNPTDEDVYRRTNSVVMSQKKPADDITFWVFDSITRPALRYTDRFSDVREVVAKLGAGSMNLQALAQVSLHNRQMLDAFEEEMVDAGYEGIMLRDPHAVYKFGRSTAKEGILLKVKRFEDSEAEIIGVEEEMFNGNEALKDNLGRTKRSTAKAGKVGKGTMGALIVRDLKTKVEFNIGSGFTATDRQAEWKNGTIVKYKFFPVGVKDKPRHPVYVGLRDARDM